MPRDSGLLVPHIPGFFCDATIIEYSLVAHYIVDDSVLITTAFFVSSFVVRGRPLSPHAVVMCLRQASALFLAKWETLPITGLRQEKVPPLFLNEIGNLAARWHRRNFFLDKKARLTPW